MRERVGYEIFLKRARKWCKPSKRT